MEFHSPTLEDRHWVTETFSAKKANHCEYSFGNIFMWSDIYENQILCDDDIFVSVDLTDEPAFCYPVGYGDKKAVIGRIIEYTKKLGEPLLFYGLSEDDKTELESFFPDEFDFEENRDFFDYLYRTEELATLAGRKYHSKRNHISYFENTFDWKYEPINESNIEQCKLLNDHWEKLNREKNPEEISEEHIAIKKALNNYFDLGFEGGVLTIQGDIVAFTFGESLSDNTFCTHVEKAYTDIRGAYQMINRELARQLLGKYEYINREDDTGSEGLRAAKLSYHPCRLVEKFTAKYKGNL